MRKIHLRNTGLKEKVKEEIMVGELGNVNW